MKWEGHQESSNVEDRRILGRKGLAIGGGGALLVLLIGALFGVEDFTHGTSAQRTKWFSPGLQTGDLSKLKAIFEMPYGSLSC